ncbi:MAG: hypothetical protein KatS3mg076_0263 [Candidatus Binatia bacterium]|nr:MAG: hypothetical protein KatS3mg076_0263 [Candidatus Binatia bacterium]
MTGRHLLPDALPTGLAACLVGAGSFFRLWFERGIAPLVSREPAAAAEVLSSFRSYEEATLVSLGATAAVGLVLLLLRDGATSPRGRLRVLALGILFGTSLLQQTLPATPALAAPAAVADTSEWIRAWKLRSTATLALHGGLFLLLLVSHRLPAESTKSSFHGQLERRHRVLLLLLGAATLFEGYDRFIVSLALPYIGKDLGAEEAELGFALSAIRMGALLSLVPGRLADRFGRRRVLLLTILAYTLATAATGLSRDLGTFVVCQIVATIFLTAELALAQVVIAEEFPAELRARGQGALGAFAALGAGVAAILFPLFQNSALGWRGLYFVGLLPLLLVAYFRSRLPETGRWQNVQAREPSFRSSISALLGLRFRTRFLVLSLVPASATLVAGAAFGFASYHATMAHGWTPAQVSTMMITGGGLGLGGWFVFGKLADSWGRRWTGAVATIGAVLAVWLYYRGGILLPSFALLVFTEAGVSIAVNALSTELFPTELRATAKAWITSAGILGAMGGLALVGLLTERLGGLPVVVPLLSVLQVACMPLLFLLPETRGAELEETLGDERKTVDGIRRRAR